MPKVLMSLISKFGYNIDAQDNSSLLQFESYHWQVVATIPISTNNTSSAN